MGSLDADAPSLPKAGISVSVLMASVAVVVPRLSVAMRAVAIRILLTMAVVGPMTTVVVVTVTVALLVRSLAAVTMSPIGGTGRTGSDESQSSNNGQQHGKTFHGDVPIRKLNLESCVTIGWSRTNPSTTQAPCQSTVNTRNRILLHALWKSNPFQIRTGAVKMTSRRASWCQQNDLGLFVYFCGKKSSGRCRDQTSFESGLACPPATQSLSWKTNAECSCRSFQVSPVRSCSHCLPSAECQASPQLVEGPLDHPPSTQIRLR